MLDQNQKNYFSDVESVITHPLSFKAKLSIGEDAYTSLRIKNATLETWDTVGVAGTAAGIASSTAVASTFFAPTGLLSLIGIGTAATPIGWVIGAGVVTAGAWMGISRYLKGATTSRVTVVPKFINTPMDVLALGLFDLIAPLAIKLANVDGHIDDSERQHIWNYFVNEWGYDKTFVSGGLSFIEANLEHFSIKELAQTLAEFKKSNPDCNYEPMSKEIIKLLEDIMVADGKVDEREEMAITAVQNIFEEVNESFLKQKISKAKVALGSVLGRG